MYKAHLKDEDRVNIYKRTLYITFTDNIKILIQQLHNSINIKFRSQYCSDINARITLIG